MDNIAYKKPHIDNFQLYLYFLPIIIIESLVLFFGFRSDLTIKLVVYIFICSLAVGLAEETFFRGLIINILRPKGLIPTIFLSSVFFSLGHLANLMAGASPIMTLFQVLLALSFGFLASTLRIKTSSLIIPIIWHTFHNFFSWITIDLDIRTEIILGSLQFFTFIFYAFYLLKKNNNEIY